jgi:hypothetical protein
MLTLYLKTELGSPEAHHLLGEFRAARLASGAHLPWRWYWQLRAILTGRVGVE